MNIPVLWVSRYDDILARGYADQGMLEAILARDIWTPPDAVVFTHHEVRGDFPEIEGALVILPARHHTSAQDVRWFREQLDRLQWSVVLLCGDEEWAFPWREIDETETRRVWTMQPVPGHEKLSGRIPGGWYPGTRAALREEPERARDRPLDFFFAGQVTHARRQACARVLRRLPGGFLHETEGYLQGMPQSDYFSLLAGAKVVPCPSGPCSVDTARTFEALEAGAVPVVDTLRPNDKAPFDYWGLLFGDDPPFPKVTDWSEFPSVLSTQLAQWPANSNRAFALWQSYKRDLALALDDDLRAVSGTARDPQGPDDLVTVVMTTSPAPLHPDTSHIEETVASIRERLPRAEIVIACDGVRPEQIERRPAYDEYLRELLWLANNRWHNVLPLVMPAWGHQANAARAAVERVRTPLLLFVEHDTPLVGDIDWDGLCRVVTSGAANVVRLHHETTVLADHRHIIGTVEHIYGVPLRPTSAWWQRPHLASTALYRERVLPIFSQDSRTMIEDVMYGIVHVAHVDGHDDWGLYVYSPAGDDIKRSTHLDSRGDDPKLSMTWAYGDDPPPGAPVPKQQQPS